VIEQVLNYRANSQAAQKGRRKVYLSMTLFWIGTCLYLWFATRVTSAVIGWGLIGVLVLVILRYSETGPRKILARAIREGKNRSLFEPITLRIEPDAIAYESVSGAGRTKWAYLERVQRTDGHLFLYHNVITAWTVPKEGVLSGDFDAFAAQVEAHFRAAVDEAERSANLAAAQSSSELRPVN
jgi:hypothetical protein